MSPLRMPLMALVYFSIATVMGELGLLAAVALKGGLAPDRVLQLMAVAHDVDLFTMWTEMEAAAKPIKEDQVSHKEVVERRTALFLDLDLREIAASKGLNDMRQLIAMLERETQRFDEVFNEFERINNEDQSEESRVRREAIQTTQRELQSMTAKQAKEQMVLLLDNTELDSQASLQFVVTIVKGMPLEKRKKILAEFKEPDDVERLHEILRRIRLGVPEVQLIRETQKRLEQFESKKK